MSEPGDSAGGARLGTRAGIVVAAGTAGVLCTVTDAGNGVGRDVLDVVSCTVPVTTPSGSAVETVPVALVIVSVAGMDTEVERRARVSELTLELVALGSAFGGGLL